MSESTRPDLYADAGPSPELRRRLARDLVRAGLLERPGARMLRAAGYAALLLIGLGAGYTWGRPGTARGEPGFLLLLHEGPEYRDDRSTAAIVAEYASWADSLRREGALVHAGKLTETALVLERNGRRELPAVGEAVPTGFFLLRVPEASLAEAIAKTAPHLRHGGRVVVRGLAGRRSAR